MFVIKPYEEKYKENVRQVCINTGPKAAATDEVLRNYILSAYCDYYIEHENENCFVLTDENDVAQGYILCASNYRKFRKEFSPYLKKIRKTGSGNFVTSLGEVLITGILSKKYPAHLHIDLNKHCRNGGYGTKMIETLCNNLKENGVCGVMLIVASWNKKAIRFYERNGFRTLASAFGGTIMAKEL